MFFFSFFFSNETPLNSSSLSDVSLGNLIKLKTSKKSIIKPGKKSIFFSCLVHHIKKNKISESLRPSWQQYMVQEKPPFFFFSRINLLYRAAQ